MPILFAVNDPKQRYTPASRRPIAAAFRRHHRRNRTRLRLRIVLALWFALIYLSALLTSQHHAFHVITGQALGLAAVYLFREREQAKFE